MIDHSFTSITEQRRLRVHEAVLFLLQEKGFRFSMDAVAAQAGCSKQTLYTQFGNKQNLLRDAIQTRIDLITSHLCMPNLSLREALITFAVQQSERCSDPSWLATSQLLMAEAKQFPDEAKTFYQNGPDAFHAVLASWLHNAIQQGLLKQDDPEMMAELFLGMLTGAEVDRQRFGVALRESPNLRRTWAEFAVDAFLRAFSPTYSSPLT